MSRGRREEGVRRAGIAGAGVLLAAALVVSPVVEGAPGVAPVAGLYRGQTSQGFTVEFQVVDDPTHGHPYLNAWFFGGVRVTCLQTSRTMSLGFAYRNQHLDTINNRFAFRHLVLVWFLRWNGTFTTQTHARGSILARFPAMKDPLGIERCDSPTVTWTADLVAAPASPAEDEKLDRFIEVTRDSEGKNKIRVVHLQ